MHFLGFGQASEHAQYDGKVVLAGQGHDVLGI